MDYQIGDLDLLNEVKDMTVANPLSQKHYVRRMYDRVAQRSAEALAALDRAGGTVALGEAEVAGLRDVLSDQSRPLPLRAAVAKALGHFQATPALKTLAAVFRDEDKKNVDLRSACMDAIGAIDEKNEYKDVKMAALDEQDIPIQEAAARALATAEGGEALREEVLVRERANDPRRLLEEGLTPAADAEAKPAEGEAKPAEGEAKPGEGEAKPGEGEAKPGEGEAKPAEGEAKPAEGEAKAEEKKEEKAE
mgnify:CR=1 FL=1